MLAHLSACQFAPLTQVGPLRERLLRSGRCHRLRGTVLISTEGIHLFLTGETEPVGSFLTELRALPELAGLEAKLTPALHQPFARLRVSIQRDLGSWDVPGIPPGVRLTPRIPPGSLAAWLNQRRSIVLIDLRDVAETQRGGLRGARPVGVTRLAELPAALRNLVEGLKRLPIVLYCADGRRSQEAGPWLQHQGFDLVLQLAGGLRAWDRVADASLLQGQVESAQREELPAGEPAPAELAPCFACGTLLRAAECLDPRYIAGTSCPQCFRTTHEQMASTLARRHELIRTAGQTLPGSLATDRFKAINVKPACEGKTLLEALESVVGHLPPGTWQRECDEGRVLNTRHEVATAGQTVKAGQTYLHKFPAVIEPPVNGEVRILHEDEALVVVNKPAPLPMHAGGRFFRNTLQHFLERAYHPERLRPSHRLDANTTGVLLVARTALFAGRLQPQFARGRVRKTYLVRVQGHPHEEVFACAAPISASSRRLGSRSVDLENGQPARTEFQVLRRDSDGTALLRAHPLTGRTNQIRVHLWHLGFPVLGDPVYLMDGALGHLQTLGLEAPPLCLHAWQIAFDHPLDLRPVEFIAPPPAWVQ